MFNSIQIARNFCEAINSHNLFLIGALMTEDHLFIDPAGNEVSGKMTMVTGWGAYFAWFPDYKIEFGHVIEQDTFVYAFGTAEGTASGTGKKWKVPAAWKIEVQNGRIKAWQVFADTRPAFDALQA